MLAPSSAASCPPPWPRTWPLSDPRIVVLSDQPPMLRGRFVAPPGLTWPTKDPSETIVYGVDFARMLRGQSVIQIDVSQTPANSLVIVQTKVVGTIGMVRLSGGTAGQSAQVSMTATLSDGERIARSISIPIMQLGLSLSDANPADLTLNGQPLLISGAPITLG